MREKRRVDRSFNSRLSLCRRRARLALDAYTLAKRVFIECRLVHTHLGLLTTSLGPHRRSLAVIVQRGDLFRDANTSTRHREDRQVDGE